MFRWRSGAALGGALFMLGGLIGACGSNGTVSPGATETEAAPQIDAAPPAPVKSDTNASQLVTSSGARVATTTGVAVEIPTGALGNNVLISIAASPASTPPEHTTLAGVPQIFGPSGLQFARPVTIVLAIDATKIPPGKTAADVVIYTAPEGTLDYTALPTKLRDITHVEATTTHFSVFLPAIPVTPDAGADSGVDAGVDAGVDSGVDADAGCAEPKTCSSFGPGACGSHDDGCGGTLSCGECTVDAGDDSGDAGDGSCTDGCGAPDAGSDADDDAGGDDGG